MADQLDPSFTWSDFVVDSQWNKKPTNWWGRQNAVPLKFDPKLSEAAFSAFFPNFDKCRSEVAGDVMSGAAVHYVGMDVH